MSITGGYKIIDFKRKSIVNGTPFVVPGIYSKANSNKPALISGLNLGGTQYQDFFGTFVPYAENSICYARVALSSYLVINVKNDDTVTVTRTAVTTDTQNLEV